MIKIRQIVKEISRYYYIKGKRQKKEINFDELI